MGQINRFLRLHLGCYAKATSINWVPDFTIGDNVERGPSVTLTIKVKPDWFIWLRRHFNVDFGVVSDSDDIRQFDRLYDAGTDVAFTSQKEPVLSELVRFRESLASDLSPDRRGSPVFIQRRKCLRYKGGVGLVESTASPGPQAHIAVDMVTFWARRLESFAEFFIGAVTPDPRKSHATIVVVG
jgi:hypothetical protein